jgi:creatinine amidohydrolase
MNWMQLEDSLERDGRIVLPLGSTEQHAYLSLATDNILAERVAVEAAEPLGVPVLPVLTYGHTPRFTAYPGSLSIDADTYLSVLSDLVGSLREQGFRRILIVNGHGGNSFAAEYMADVRWHDWWSSERQRELIVGLGDGSHASWMENFPWTRLPSVDLPDEEKAMVAISPDLPPAEARAAIGDGSFGGVYQRPDEDMQQLWDAAVAEIRALIEAL